MSKEDKLPKVGKEVEWPKQNDCTPSKNSLGKRPEFDAEKHGTMGLFNLFYRSQEQQCVENFLQG